MCSVLFDYHGKRGGKLMDKTVSWKISVRAIKQAAYLRTRHSGSACQRLGVFSQHPHSDLAEAQWVSACVISAASRRNFCAEEVVPSH